MIDHITVSRGAQKSRFPLGGQGGFILHIQKTSDFKKEKTK